MYKTRREKLLASLPEYSMTFIFSGKAPYAIGDEKYPFEVNRSFYYFTGLDKEDMVLVLIKMGAKTIEELYIPPFDDVMAKWVGGRVKKEEATEVSGIESVFDIDLLKSNIAGDLNSYGKIYQFTLCADLSKQEYGQPWAEAQFINEIREQYPACNVKNIFEEIAIMRLIKSEEEISMMSQAISVTKAGIETMMQYAHQNVWENELEAYFDYVLKCAQCGHAFTTICAAGKNATVLHYTKNNDYARTDDLILVDCGASYQYYNADVTRVFPASGSFTVRQREIYDIVLRANKFIETIAAPGLTTKKLNERLIEFYQVELEKIGLLKDGKTVRDYYWHGVSHMLGLETHDVALPDYPLQPGCVITNEPGLYLEEEGIGIRIEDDLLITEDGCINLTQSIVKEIDEIEDLVSR